MNKGEARNWSGVYRALMEPHQRKNTYKIVLATGLGRAVYVHAVVQLVQQRLDPSRGEPS